MNFIRYTFTPSESAASGSSPAERSRSPNGVFQRMKYVSGNMTIDTITSDDTLVVTARIPLAASDRKKRCWPARSRNGDFRNGIRSRLATLVGMVGDSRAEAPSQLTDVRKSH